MFVLLVITVPGDTSILYLQSKQITRLVMSLWIHYMLLSASAAPGAGSEPRAVELSPPPAWCHGMAARRHNVDANNNNNKDDTLTWLLSCKW